MKLAVILPTRGKPDMCAACIRSFQHLESGNNDVRYFVRVDTDEKSIYWNVAQRLHGDKVEFIIEDAPITPAEKGLSVVNSQNFKDFDPDVHVMMSDDVLPLTFHWDAVIVAAIEQIGDAFCWTEAGDPTNTGYIVLSKKYVKAMPSYLTAWFPFWFSDRWRAEVYMMVFGRNMPIVSNLVLGGKRGKTHGMQDVGFWFDFFAKTREDRLKEAEVLARNLGLRFGVSVKLLEHLEQWDEAQKERCKDYEQNFGGNPSARYLEAKSRAEKYLLTNI